jgi:hypothetical protein
VVVVASGGGGGGGGGLVVVVIRELENQISGCSRGRARELVTGSWQLAVQCV